MHELIFLVLLIVGRSQISQYIVPLHIDKYDMPSHNLIVDGLP